MSAASGTRAIIAALAANLGIAVTKFIAFLLTASSSMLAESIHSVADSGNQALLLLGGRRAKREATPEHPFGFGRERYVYAFIVSIVLFSVGGLFALYEGYHKLSDPHPITQMAMGADRRAGGRDRVGDVLVPYRDRGEQQDPRQGDLGRLRSALARARAARGAAGGSGRPHRPGPRSVRRRADPDHRQRRLGRHRDRPHRCAAGRCGDHPGNRDEEPADRRVGDARGPGEDRGRCRGWRRDRADHPHEDAPHRTGGAARRRQGRRPRRGHGGRRRRRRSTRPNAGSGRRYRSPG